MKEYQKKYNYIYKIVNNINGKFYIGKRSCDCEIAEDKYMGSGVGLHRAFKKYGIENFTKEILSTHNTFQEAYNEENILVTEELINNPQCYNMRTGGLYNECVFTQEVKDKISAGVRRHISTDGGKRAEKMREVQKLSQLPEAKEKRKQANLKWYKENHTYREKPDYQVLPGAQDAYSFWAATDLSTGEVQLSFNSFKEFTHNGKPLTTAIHSDLKKKYGDLNKIKKVREGIEINVYRPRFGTTFKIEKFPRFVHIKLFTGRNSKEPNHWGEYTHK